MALKKTAEYYKLTDAANNSGTYYKVYDNGLFNAVLCFTGAKWERSHTSLASLLATTDNVNIFGHRLERCFRRVA